MPLACATATDYQETGGDWRNTFLDKKQSGMIRETLLVKWKKVEGDVLHVTQFESLYGLWNNK